MTTNQWMQDWINGFNAREQMRRAESSQMTLGELIKILESLADEPNPRVCGLGRLHSYRGYYCDLAFEPREVGEGGEQGERGERAVDLLSRCKDAMGKVFQGYKGGDYLMGETTPLWVSVYGEASGQRLMRLIEMYDPPCWVPVVEFEEE